MAGSQTIAEALMPQLVEAYGLENDLSLIKSIVNGAPNTFRYELEDGAGEIIQTVNITANSTDEGLLALVEQTADLTLASRRVRADEDQLLSSAGVGRMMGTESERVIALDGIVVIVSRGNDISALSEEQMAAVFSGQAKNWYEMGGPDVPIKVYRRENGSAAAEIFTILVLDEFGVRMRSDAQVVTSDAELSDRVRAILAGSASPALPISAMRRRFRFAGYVEFSRRQQNSRSSPKTTRLPADSMSTNPETA